jgi:hypothetical protein
MDTMRWRSVAADIVAFLWLQEFNATADFK